MRNDKNRGPHRGRATGRLLAVASAAGLVWLSMIGLSAPASADPAPDPCATVVGPDGSSCGGGGSTDVPTPVQTFDYCTGIVTDVPTAVAEPPSDVVVDPAPDATGAPGMEPGSDASDVPPETGVDPTEVPMDPGVDVTEVPPDPGVDVTDVPVDPGVDVTDVPVDPGVVTCAAASGLGGGEAPAADVEDAGPVARDATTNQPPAASRHADANEQEAVTGVPLANTGSSGTALALVAGALLLVGVVVTVTARPSKHH